MPALPTRPAPSRPEPTTKIRQLQKNSDIPQHRRLPTVSAAPQSESIQREEIMLGSMAGRSVVMQRLFVRMRTVAPHFRVATVEGEAGVGKLLAAETLHDIGPAAHGPFAPWTAADFLQSAVEIWRETRNGLIYLSRVDELSPDRQARLDEFLEWAARERIRHHAPAAPLQLVVGTSQPLRKAVAEGAFRSDLASRFGAIRLPLPPLRERRDDIPLLAELFLQQWSARHGKPLRGFMPPTIERLTDHFWPGNVRELETVVTAAAMQTASQWIRPIDLPRLEWPAVSHVYAAKPVLDDFNLDRAIRQHIARVLLRVNGNKVRAARLLGISRSTLYRMMNNAEWPISIAQ